MMKGTLGDVLTTAAFLVVLCATGLSHGRDILVIEPDPPLPTMQAAESVEPQASDTLNKINWLCTTRYKAEQKHMHVNWGDHPLLKEPERAKEIADAVDAAAQATGFEVSTILTIAWFESRLEKKVGTLEKKGSLGEMGLMQCHGKAVKNCDLTTIQGQVTCGSNWLKTCLDTCGSLKGAIAYYATGKSCTAQGSIDLMVQRRLALKQQLEALEKEQANSEIASSL